MLHYVGKSRNYLRFISQVLRCTVHYVTLHYITVSSSECQLLVAPVKNTKGKFYFNHTWIPAQSRIVDFYCLKVHILIRIPSFQSIHVIIYCLSLSLLSNPFFSICSNSITVSTLGNFKIDQNYSSVAQLWLVAGTNLISDIYHNRSVFALSHQRMFHGSARYVRGKNFTLIFFIDLAL